MPLGLLVALTVFGFHWLIGHQCILRPHLHVVSPLHVCPPFLLLEGQLSLYLGLT